MRNQGWQIFLRQICKGKNVSLKFMIKLQTLLLSKRQVHMAKLIKYTAIGEANASKDVIHIGKEYHFTLSTTKFTAFVAAFLRNVSKMMHMKLKREGCTAVVRRPRLKCSYTCFGNVLLKFMAKELNCKARRVHSSTLHLYISEICICIYEP